MNMKQQYEQSKKENVSTQLLASIFVFIFGLSIIGAFLYGSNLLWNFVAPKFGLPILKYLEFVGAFLLIRVLNTLFFIKVTTKSKQQSNLGELLKKN